MYIYCLPTLNSKVKVACLMLWKIFVLNSNVLCTICTFAPTDSVNSTLITRLITLHFYCDFTSAAEDI